MSGAKRINAGAAISGLFARTWATGGLARRDPDRVERSSTTKSQSVDRLRQGVELTTNDVDFLRSLSRPARTGQPRTLGSKFVATGVLAAAIELLREGDIDMAGVETGDIVEMTARARDALTEAASSAATTATPTSPESRSA